jgi:hypothetical protein
MVVLATISVFMVTINMQILLNRRIVEHRQHQVQALWLARSGVEVAAARLGDEKYTGETLAIIPDSLVRIDVQRAKDANAGYNVSVEAKYPTESSGHSAAHALQRQLRSPGKAAQVQTRSMP